MFCIAEGPGWLAIRGPLVDNVTHRHRAMQLTLAIAGTVHLDGGPAWRNVLIGGDHRHRVEAEDALTLLIDPETRWAGELSSGHLDRERVCHGLDLEAAALLRRLAREPNAPGDIDPRVLDVLAWVQERSEAGRMHEVSLAAASRRACLSESRFLHVFREHAGVTWRRGLMWRRALAAMREVSGGASLTEAAHAAGYADSAHFSRQFKGLFGFAPSRVAQHSRFVQVEALIGPHALD